MTAPCYCSQFDWSGCDLTAEHHPQCKASFSFWTIPRTRLTADGPMLILSLPISGDDEDERPWVSMLIDGDEKSILVNGEPVPDEIIKQMYGPKFDGMGKRPTSSKGISLDEISTDKK